MKPINLNDDPRFREASTLLEKLKADLLAVGKLIESNLSTLSEVSAARRSRVEEQAHAMLAGQSDDALNASAEAARIRADIEAAQLKRPALHRAIEMQRQIVESLRHEWHQQVCRDLEQRHAELVRTIAQRLIALDEALQAETELRDAVYQKTGLHHPVPMGIGALGLLRDEYSTAAGYLIECAKHGYLKKSELPEHLRARVPIPTVPAKVTQKPIDTDGWLNATA